MLRPPGSISLSSMDLSWWHLLSQETVYLQLPFALFLPSTFASCLVLPVDIISGLTFLSLSLTICFIQNNQQTLFKLLQSNIYFLIMSVFLLFTTCSFPPAVSVFPACSLPLTYVHPQCHYSSFLSFSVLLFLPFSFLCSSLWPVTERIINEHHNERSLY